MTDKKTKEFFELHDKINTTAQYKLKKLGYLCR